MIRPPAGYRHRAGGACNRRSELRSGGFLLNGVPQDVGPEPPSTTRTVPSCRQKSQQVAFRTRAGLYPWPATTALGALGGACLTGWVHPRMTRKLLYVTLVAALAAVAVVAFALPAGAAQRTFKVKLVGGSIITVTVDAACVPMDQVPGLPGTPIEDLTPPDVYGGGGEPTAPPPPATTPTQPTTPTTPQDPGKDPGPNANNGNDGGSKSDPPSSGHGHRQHHSGSRAPADRSDSSSNSHSQG